MKNLLIGLCCVMCTICQYTYADNIQNTKQVLEVKLETGQVVSLTDSPQVLADICGKVKLSYSEFSEWVGSNQQSPVGPALGGKLVIEDSMYGMGTEKAYNYLTESCKAMNKGDGCGSKCTQICAFYDRDGCICIC